MITVVDSNGEELRIGMKVDAGMGYIGVITEISDPDGDVDEEGLTIGIPPKVYVTGKDAQNNEWEDSFSCNWTAKGYWDEDAPYEADELTIVKEPS